TFYPYDPIKAVPPHAFTNPNAAVTSYNFPVPGIYDSVIAITYNNACPDTAILYDTFVVQGQISLFDFEIDCDTPTLVRFKDSTSSDHYTRVWLFGDGNSDTSKNPVHVYAGTNIYQVTLITTDTQSGCSHSTTLPVDLSLPNVDFFASDTAICMSDTIHLSYNTNVILNSPSITISPNQVFIDTPLLSYAFLYPGVYDITLTYSYKNCWFSKTKNNYIIVADPDSNFTATPLIGCAPFSVNFLSGNHT